MAVRVLEGGGGEHTENRWGPSESAGGGVLRQSSIAQVREWRVDDAPVRAGRDHERLRSQWPVLIRDHRDGYLGWARPTMFRLAGNRTNTGVPPTRRDRRRARASSLRLLRQADAHQLQTAISAPPTSAPAAPRATTPTCRSVAAATTDELAARLNAVGLTTGTRAPFDVKAVQVDPDTTTTSPPRTPYTDGETVSPRPPTGSAAASAWSTTGSRPANSPLDAAPATGSASPGPSTSKPNAAAASPNPDTSTRWPPHQIPRPTLTGPHRVGADWHHHCGRPIDQRNSISDENIPIHDCRRGNMKHPSPAIADVA